MNGVYLGAYQDHLKQAHAQAQAQANAQNAPKELGLLQRADGLRSGLDELAERLQGFISRISGEGFADACSQPQAAPGLQNTLKRAEDRLRECLAMLTKLNDAF